MTSSSAATDAPAWFTDAVATTPHLATVTVDGAAVAYRTWDAPDDPVSGQLAPGVMLVHGGQRTPAGGTTSARSWRRIRATASGGGLRPVRPRRQ